MIFQVYLNLKKCQEAEIKSSSDLKYAFTEQTN